jgi:hypothetical protein
VNAADCIRALDRSLDMASEPIILRRTTAGTRYEAKIRGLVRAFRPEELVGGITQTDSRVILSPTDIRAAGWPNAVITTASPYQPDPQIPRINDTINIQGRNRNITAVSPFYLMGELVRIELTVAG